MDDVNNDGIEAGGINIIHLNVASLMGAHKLEMLKKQVERSEVDVFCASETWLHEGIPDGLVELKGYNLTRLDRMWAEIQAHTKSKKGGGLICYVKNDLDYNEYRYSFLNNSSRDLEMQWVSLEVKNMKRIVIINVYRPPKGDYKAGCKLIHEAIKRADLKDNVEIFLMGDFNIDLKDRSSKATRELKTTTELWGLRPLFNKITRPNGSKGSCIDNIFTNSGHIAASKVLNWNFSDHLPVYAKRKRTSLHHAKVDFYGRSYRNYGKEELQLELLQGDWAPFYESNDPNWCWEFIENSVTGYLNRTCPLKKFKVKEVREPWVTNEILEEIKDKDRALKVARRSGAKEDWDRARRERNRVGRLVEEAKADFLTEQQQLLADDPKKFWRLVKSIVPGNKAKSARISLITKSDDGRGSVNIDPADSANYIN